MSKEKQDMADLIETALHAENKVKRSRAVRRINDPEILTHIALHDRAAFVRLAAVKKVDDPETLLRIVRNEGSGDVRRAAAEKITDPGTLKLIALNDDDIGVRCAAVSNPGADQETLIHIVMHDDCAAVRLKAVCWIDDIKVLKHVA